MLEYRRVCAEVNLTAIERNIDMLMSSTAPGTKSMAIIKSDAYGHGDLPVAKAIDERIDAYAVATAYEAVKLRNNGINKMILVLGVAFPEEYELLIRNNVSITVFDIDTVKELNRIAKELGTKAICHVKVDTGMRRIGLKPDDEGYEQVFAMSKCDNVVLEGIFTHFARADEADRSHTMEQLQIFEAFVERLKGAGVEFEYVHSSNSAGVFNVPEANQDMVRLGVSLYGLYPSDMVNKRRVMLFPALELKSHITMIKTVKAGESISYGGTFVAPSDMKIATVPVGYGDGYPRCLSNKGRVLINGKTANICGRVCMDQFMVDVTDIEDVKLYDQVVLIGTSGDECITVEEIANMADTINYEIVCGLSKRIPRRYYRDNRVVARRDYFNETAPDFTE